MGSFICSISERDWEISRTKGIYGNKEGNIRRDGSYHEFSPSVKYSIIRDLVGMRKRDKVFFHVLTDTGPSRVHGVWVVRENPFYDTSKIWKNPHEVFPYRFLFEPHHNYTYLCNHDANMEVIDFYELIEQRKIWSLATLENERNIETRRVRKIESGAETKEILRILHRDYRHRRVGTNISFSPYELPSNLKPLAAYIQDIGRYENSIKALLMCRIGQNNPSIANILGNVSDFMNEVFIAQTTRKSIDILCIQSHVANSRRYIICEVKKDRCSSDSLSQLLYYMDLFKRKELVDIHSDAIIGCLVGQRFDREVIDFSQRKNAQGINGSIFLIEYKPIEEGKDACFTRIA